MPVSASPRAEPPPARPLPPGLTIRPVGPQDADGLAGLLRGLSREARERRFFTGAVDLERAIDWAAHPDAVGACGLVAEQDGVIAGHGVLVPVDASTGEVAFEVAEPWRRHGVAGALLQALEDEARRRGLTRLVAEVLARNRDMLAVLREHGPTHETGTGADLRVVLPVAPRRPGAKPRRRVGKVRSA